VIVRLGVPAELGAIRAVLDEVDAFHRAALPWLFCESKEPARDDALSDFVSKPDHAAFVTEAPGGGLSGVLLVLIREPKRVPIVRPTRICELDALGVAPGFQRKGIGTALVRAGLAWGREQGATRSELGVYEFNERARAFWASVGFETLSRRMVMHFEGK
jgi:GNAT superfamily N-acetyltransferase